MLILPIQLDSCASQASLHPVALELFLKIALVVSALGWVYANNTFLRPKRYLQ